MNRFESVKEKKNIVSFSFVYAIVFLLVLLLLILGANRIASNDNLNGAAVLSEAIERNMVHCYATEGFYPPSVEYMEEHYGLIYDHDKYRVDYEVIGNNILPDFTIIELGGGVTQ